MPLLLHQPALSSKALATRTHLRAACHRTAEHPHGSRAAAAAYPALLLLLPPQTRQATHPCLQTRLQVRQQARRQLLLLLLADWSCCSCWPCLPVGVPGQLAACLSVTAEHSSAQQQISSSACAQAGQETNIGCCQCAACAALHTPASHSWAAHMTTRCSHLIQAHAMALPAAAACNSPSCTSREQICAPSPRSTGGAAPARC